MNLWLHWISCQYIQGATKLVISCPKLPQISYCYVKSWMLWRWILSRSLWLVNDACKQNGRVRLINERSKRVHDSWCFCIFTRVNFSYLFYYFFNLNSVTCILRWASYKEKPLCPQCKHPFESLSVHRSLDGWLAWFIFFSSFFISCLCGA